MNYDDPLVSIKQLNAKWNEKLVESTLTDIHLNVRRGELVVVIGHVGSGKVIKSI